MSRDNLRRRINALNSALNPAGSLRAKFAKLTDDQRRTYDCWRDQCRNHHRAGHTFERLLAGEAPPPLRRDVHDALFGPTINILADATIADAAETYRRLAFGD